MSSTILEKNVAVPELSYAQWVKICLSLEKYHGIFGCIFRIGRFRFDRKFPTAWVQFSKSGNQIIDFCFNPDFWDSLDQFHRELIICHECLHIILNHGVRLKNMTAMGISSDGKEYSIGNIATDIAINEMLVNSFDFNKYRIDVDICLIDTVFRDKKYQNVVQKDESAEYYYNLLLENSIKVDIDSLDNHSGLEDMPDNAIKKISETIDRNLSEEEKKDLLKKLNKNEPEFKEAKDNDPAPADDKKNTSQNAGTIAGNIEKIVEKLKYKPKKKWETIITSWVRKHLMDYKEQETWINESKRIKAINKRIILPGELEIETGRAKGKLDLYFIMDSSGSCANLAKRFFDAAYTIPRHRFNINLGCFDTKYYECSFKDRKLKGFGGTSFSCISDYINSLRKKPDAIFVITDGYSSDMPDIAPVDRKKWYWFLTEKYTNYIPDGCKIYDLNKFE